jgi:hypothetical protein
MPNKARFCSKWFVGTHKRIDANVEQCEDGQYVLLFEPTGVSAHKVLKKVKVSAEVAHHIMSREVPIAELFKKYFQSTLF